MREFRRLGEVFLLVVLAVAGLVLLKADPIKLPRAHAEWGVDKEGPVGTIQVTTSTGTTKRLLVARPTDTAARIYLQGQLVCDNHSVTAAHDLTLWSWDGSGTPTQLGPVIPLSASSGSPRTSVGGFVIDARGGAIQTLDGEALYFSIDNSAGAATDVSVSGSYTTRRP